MARNQKTNLGSVCRAAGVSVPDCRRLAGIPWERVEGYFERLRNSDDGEISTSRILELAKVDDVLEEVKAAGWQPKLTPESYEHIVAAGLRGKNLPLAFVATEICVDEHPLTLRGLMYRVVSAGWLPATDIEHYNRLGRLMTTLREAGVIPFKWIVDSVRKTDKPGSWTGISEFIDTVQDAYRKDFWASLPEYVHIIAEKDAIAGTLTPVTHRYDVSLSPMRGYTSLSFANEIAEEWNRIEKPIHAYFLGDFDASGFDLERDIREKLTKYCDRSFEWTRLAVLPEDFAEFKLIPLAAKKSDRRYKAFVDTHGHDCAELDAIPPTELRRRVEEAIVSHIPQAEWKALQEMEKREKESFSRALKPLRQKAG